METRSRKRAEASPAAASSSSGPTTRSSKRARLSSPPSISKRSRTSQSQEGLVSPVMESPDERRGRHRHSSGKGKEKEHVRVRGRDKHRDLGFNADNAAGDDNDSDEAGVGVVHHNLTSAGSALQGLLRKLGAGLDDLLPSSGMMASASSSHQSGRLKKILSGIRADGEDGKQIEALTQLCEILSIGTEDSLSNFSVESFVPGLVSLLNHESNPDIMLLAARALTHLCDVLPSSCATVVHYGAVSCFCARLLTIEYMDLAEQSLQALKKISQEHPTACLRAGALMAVLSYLDFFPTGIQRVALSTAANMCRKLPTDAADFVMEVVPLLTTLLQHHDAKVLEHASVCLTRISEAFASSSDRLDELCNHGIVGQTASLISVSNSGTGQASLSASTYTGLIRVLSTLASGSPLGAKTLLLLGISGILKDTLSGPSTFTGISISPALSRPPDQIFEIVNLANELLPPLRQGAVSLPTSSNICARGTYLKKSPPRSLAKHEGANGNIVEASAREKLLNEQPDLLKQFGLDLLPVLIQIYGSSVNSFVRHKCLSVLGKLMYFSSADMIQSLLEVSNIASFLAGILAWKDPHVLAPALQIAEILMEKLPSTFSKTFVREGVVHAMDALISVSPAANMTAQQSHADRSPDSVPIAMSQTRRNRRHSDNSNSDMTSLGESKGPISLNISSPQNSLEISKSGLSIGTTVGARVKSFKNKYFPSGPGSGEVGVTDDLLKLRNLSMKLNAGVRDLKIKAKGKLKASTSRFSDSNAANEDKLVGIVSEIFAELSKGEGVSIFEFISSGIVDAFLNYFSCGCYSEGKLSEANLREFRQQALKRYRHFVKVALCYDLEGKNVVPLSVLVQKLQNSLSSLERFPVLLSHSARSSGGRTRISSGLSILSQPVKLRLSRAQDEKSLRDYSSNIIAIDPLASLAAVEDFLWPRVQRDDEKNSGSTGKIESDSQQTGVGTSSHATRSRSSMSNNTKKYPVQENIIGSSKAKGKAVLKSTEDLGGPRTRNCTRREALDRDVQANSVDGRLSSEDEELDFVIEDDDILDDEGVEHDNVLGGSSLQIFTPEKVHDVKLSDTNEDTICRSVISSQVNTALGSSSRVANARVSDSTGYRSGNFNGSRGAMSFAVAAMAGLTCSNGGNTTGGRDWPSRMLIDSNYPPRLIFSAGGKQLNRNLTIYQAIQRQLMFEEGDDEKVAVNDLSSSNGNRFWSDVYNITYQRADSQSDKPCASGSHTPVPKYSKTRSAPASRDGSSLQECLLDSIMRGDIPCDIEKSNATYGVLALLRVLEGLNRLASDLRISMIYDKFAEGNITSLEKLSVIGPKVPTEEFISNKLTSKLARQIQDGLALCSGNIPSWCCQLTKACPFLFLFETRRQYFYSTAFGLSRALYHLQQQQSAYGQGSTSQREARFGRLQRQKVRVSRNQVLESAMKVMELYAGQKTVLEVEYFGEVGTGLGPTLEFYTLLSHDFQKAGLCMWRSASQVDCEIGNSYVSTYSTLVEAPLGLFPRPWLPNVDASESTQMSKVVENFRLLGRVVAKALQDGRLLDIPFSVAFYKLLLYKELDLNDICFFDMEFGKSLQELQALVYRKRYLESTGNTRAISSLCVRGVTIEDLCLDFTLPGYPNYTLKKGEENVTLNNLEDYLTLVVDATVKSGIKRQMEAFRSGFNQVFDISYLQVFFPDELDDLLCGRRELWEAETLAEHIKFDHGYTSKSPPIIYLLEIMGEFTPEQQRAFCQFVTGAPRLPPGGLAALNPRLTIVRKHSSTAVRMSADGTELVNDDLPSVMTCANYLKLPPYSTKEIMYKKLLYAIYEGQGSFDLS